jgi:hypothetical protein
MDKIMVVRSEVVEPSSNIKSLDAPTGGNSSLKPKENFYQRPHHSDPPPSAACRRCVVHPAPLP